MERWTAVASHANFGLLGPEDQESVRANWLYGFSQKPDFKALPEADQRSAYMQAEAVVRPDELATNRMSYIDRVYGGESDLGPMILDNRFWEMPTPQRHIALARRSLEYRGLNPDAQDRGIKWAETQYDKTQASIKASQDRGKEQLVAGDQEQEFEDQRGIVGETASAIGSGFVRLAGAAFEIPGMIGRRFPGAAATPPRPLEARWYEPEYYYDVAESSGSLRRKGRMRGIRPLAESLADPIWWARNLGENAPQLAASVGANALGGKALGFLSMMALEGTTHYRSALQDGADEKVAFREASIVGLVNGALEMIGGDAVVKAFKKGGLRSIGRFISDVITTAGVEGGTEGLQTQVSEHVRKYGHKPDLTELAIMEGTVTSALIGMALGGGASVLANAASASRKDFSGALGVPQSKLPPEYNTQIQREKALAEAREAREALGAEQAAQRREDFQRQREAPPEVAPIEPPVEQAPVEAPQPEDAEMEPPLDDVAIDEGPVAYPEEGRPGVVEEEAKEAEKAAEADVMREEAQAEQAPAEAPPMEAVAPQDDRPKQSPARTDVVTQADWLRHASLEAKLFKDKALTPDQQAEYEALNEKIGRHYAGPDRFSRETQDVPAEAPVDTEVEGEAAIADAIENPEDASFLSRQADAARARAAKRGPPGARLNVGIPVDQIADMAIIGMDNFAKGARTFTQWSRTMIAELGDGVKGNLKWLWDHLADERKALTQQAYRIGGRVRAGVKAGKDKPLSWTPEKLFNYAMHHEARGSRAGYRAGQLDQKATVQELLEYANAMLPASEAKIVAKAVKRISKARTPGEIKKVVDAINRMAGNYEKASAKKEFRQTLKRVKKADLRDEFRKKVDTILDGIAITQPRDATLDRFEQLLKAADLDDIGEIPQALIDKAQTALGKVGLPALSDMEAADIRDVSRAIEAIINLSGRKNLLLYGKQQREEKKAHAAVNDEIVERLGSKYALVPGKRDSYSRRSPVRKTAGASQQNHQVRTFRLFGRNPIGEAPVSVGRTILYDNLQDADRGHKSKMQETEDAVNTLLDEAGVDRAKLPSMSEAVSGRRLWGTRHAQALARGKSLVEATTKADTLSVDLPTATTETGARVRKLEMTAAERMHLLLHFLDSDTRAQVLSNQASGIVFDRRPGMKPVGLKVGDVRAIIDSASDQERQIVLGVHALINGPMRNAVNAYWLKKYGYNLSERSDYTPRRRDASGKDEDIDANQAAFIRNLRETLEDQPIVQDRTGSKLPIVVGDIFGELFAHANQVYALSEKADAIEDARRLLGNAKFKETVKEALRFGTDELAYMKLVLDEFEGLRKPDRGDFDQVVKAVMKGARRGLLGLKPNIVLYQPASYALASSVIPESVLYRPDVLNPMGHAEVIAEMRAEAPEMRARIDGSGSQIITPLVEGSSVGDFYHVPGPKMDKVALGPIHAADTVVMVQLWRASKIMGEKAGRNPGPELKEYTRDMMREVVARSQPSWDEMHSSMLAIQARSKALMAPLVVFSSQINKLGNIITENVYDIEHVVRKHTIEGQKRGLKGTKLAEYVTKKAATPTAKAVKNLGMATVVNAAMIVAIRALYFGGISLVAGAIMGGGDDREKGKEFWTKSILAVVDQMLGLWMVYGDAISTANRALRKGMEYKSSLFVRPRQTIPYAAAEAAIKAVGETSNALSRAQDGKKNKMQLYRAMNHYVDLLSFGGVPLQGPWAIVRPFAKPRKATPKPKRRKH